MPAPTPANPPATAAAGGVVKIIGVFVKTVYSKPDSSWRIMTFDLAATDEATRNNVSVKGEISAPLPGAEYEIEGIWEKGRGAYADKDEFKALSFTMLAPSDATAVARVLDLLKWCGPIRSAKAIAKFGAAALDELHSDPANFAEQVGMPENQAMEAREAFLAARYELETKKRLYEMLPGVHNRVVNRLWENHGVEAPAVVTANPWGLCEYEGIGWETADKISQQLKCPQDSPNRIMAGANHVLGENEENGNTIMPLSAFKADMEKCLSLKWPVIHATLIDDVFNCDEIVGIPDEPIQAPQALGTIMVQRAVAARHESQIADALFELCESARGDLSNFSLDKCVTADGLPLDESQIAAVKGLLENGCGVLSGGPGSGKTTIVRVLLNCLPSNRYARVLGAPTGKAARVIRAATGHEAKTIHSLLSPERIDMKKNRWSFRHGPPPAESLPISVLFIDETSMVDHFIAAQVLGACEPGTWVFFVGDVNQLQSVGPGDFLGTMCREKVWPVYQLTKVHRNGGIGRQACADIIAGRLPASGNMAEPASTTGNNFWIIPMPAEQQPALAARIATEWAPSKGFDPRRDVVVLSANSKKRGMVCAPALNAHLQGVVNPEGVPTEITDWNAEVPWRNGDRVMQKKNNYEKNLINGDVLTFVGMAEDNPKTAVFETDEADEDTGEKRKRISSGEAAANMALAYAATVHKYQGSQSPVVIICLDFKSQSMVTTREWLYTAISRFQKFCFLLVADPGDIGKVIAQRGARRLTGLADSIAAVRRVADAGVRGSILRQPRRNRIGGLSDYGLGNDADGDDVPF